MLFTGDRNGLFYLTNNEANNPNCSFQQEHRKVTSVIGRSLLKGAIPVGDGSFLFNKTSMRKDLNTYSKTITQDETQPAAQAMLHAIGLSKDDLKKAQVGIASTGWEGNPCNMHLNQLATRIKSSSL